MAETATEPKLPSGELLHLDMPPEGFTTLSVAKRRIGLRIVPYGVVAESRYGPIMFEEGAFGDVDPREVRLRMDHADPPTGTGRTFSEKDGAAYMEFAVSRTQRGDEQLELASDGTSTGASVGFHELDGVKAREIDGRRVLVFPPNSASLDEVSTTWQPTFTQAGVVYVMNKQGDTPVAETQETPDVSVTPNDSDRTMVSIVERALKSSDDRNMELSEKLDKVFSSFGDWQTRFEEMARENFRVPRGEEARKAKLSHWVEVTLRRMAGQTISPSELRTLALDDIITTEQPGLVPATFTPDYDDLINNDRPFLSSTRNVEPPVSGNSMTLPIMISRAAAGSQAGSAEKAALTTTAGRVGTGSFNYQSVFGGADISIQMINRAERSFFDLLTGDMAMAYALDCETKAIAALITGYTDSASVAHAPVAGGVMDPEDLTLGAAWETAISVYKRAPDTIWMSAAAVGAFIDAKAPLTNAPLYSNLAASFTTGGGPGGFLSGLRPIYVPALDDG